MTASQRIDNAIRWLRINQDAIAQALPIATPGRVFGDSWLDTLEPYITRYQSSDGSMSNFCAVAYIVNPLVIIRAHLDQP